MRKTPSTIAERPRLLDIDLAKGLAIFLVVAGHLWSRGSAPPEASGYIELKRAIYLFHMPFFMYLSGVIFHYSYTHIGKLRDYISYAKIKFARLAPSYLIFGLIIVFSKMLLDGQIHIENTETDIFHAITTLLLIPANSVAGSLWYIYVLLELYLVVPVLIILLARNINALLIFSLVVHFIPATSYLMLNLLFEYLLFFSVGIFALKHYDRYRYFIDRYSLLFLCLFALSFLCVNLINHQIAKLVIGLCSIPALHGLVSKLVSYRLSFLYLLGKYSFVIYLMNTIAIGAAKAITVKAITITNSNMLIINVFLLLAGLLAPIITKKYLFDRFHFLRRITS